MSEMSKQQKRGSAYVAKTTDTLWSIATAAAPDGATIEQTMLAILAENPIAFDAQNVNGLKSGYVLHCQITPMAWSTPLRLWQRLRCKTQSGERVWRRVIVGCG
ncbi:MAG: hypothetical protein CM15mP84_09160 [Cellvibrionales bacterium]|nr:MAG: hypothetical protein CM15mP84_09160 [Cellvibrionales bacterium]